MQFCRWAPVFLINAPWLAQPLGPKATVTKCLVSKRGIPKRGILKSLIYLVLNFKSWIKLIYNKIACTYCVINEFNSTFEAQNMANEAFKNASFGNASFGNGNEDYNCLRAGSQTEPLSMRTD